MSLYWLPPVIWFGAMGAIMLFSCSRTTISFQSGSQAFASAWRSWLGRATRDPAHLFAYQLLERTAKPDGLIADPVGWKLLSESLQFCRQQARLESGADRYVRAYYEFPYNSIKRRSACHCRLGQRQRRRDRAADGVAHVDAIEIDPAIAFLGTKYHPERPYDDPRVTLSINDARNFFARPTRNTT